MADKSTFALFFGNRGFFPASLMKEAREQLPRVLGNVGHKTLMLPEDATNAGAVETPTEGQVYANFLKEHAGEFDGVILSLPNFGDETGAVTALKDAGVPILIQAYPDDLDKMAPALRRDAFCGKFSIMDVFCQYGVKFSALTPHTVHPESEQFAEHVEHFDGVCRVVRAASNMVVGAIGARTTAFKTVRIDELALQKNGITMETYDLSDVFGRMRSVDEGSDAYRAKAERLRGYADWSVIPDVAFTKLAKLGVAIDSLVEECSLDAVALRCWLEMQEQLGVSPCVLISEMNDRFVVTACEVDVGNAVSMYALSQASGQVATCLDWNNNWGDDEDKCILFHCGPVPQSMMTGKGQVTDHAIVSNVLGEGRAYGCNVGRISPSPFTFGSLVTRDGDLHFYLGEGEFTEDAVPEDFFGCAGCAQIDALQDVLLHVGRNGHRHHVSVTPGYVMAPVAEALGYYLDYEVALPQYEA